jgi:hypothetical protein
MHSTTTGITCPPTLTCKNITSNQPDWTEKMNSSTRSFWDYRLSVHIAEKYVRKCVFKQISQTLQSVKKNVFCILSQTGLAVTAGMLTYLHLYDEKSVPSVGSYFHLTARCKWGLGDFAPVFLHCPRGWWFAARIRGSSCLLRLFLQRGGHPRNFLWGKGDNISGLALYQHDEIMERRTNSRVCNEMHSWLKPVFPG